MEESKTWETKKALLKNNPYKIKVNEFLPLFVKIGFIIINPIVSEIEDDS